MDGREGTGVKMVATSHDSNGIPAEDASGDIEHIELSPTRS